MSPKHFALAFAALLYRAGVVDADGFRLLTAEIEAIPDGTSLEGIHSSTLSALERDRAAARPPGHPLFPHERP